MEKKIGIITHYDVHNHGAHLQLYALQQVLREFGYNASALRYTKNYDFMPIDSSKKYNITLSSIPFYFRYLMKKGVRKTLFNIKKRKILKDFRKEQNLVGEYYSRETNLDKVVIGSDEIFSIESGLNPWFWGMGIPCQTVISYAPSFGPTTVEFIREKKAEEFIRAGISRISKISVRDKNSQDIISEVAGVNATIVCDPVLLYGFSKEIDNVKVSLPKKKYILIYSYDNTMNEPERVAEIKKYAKENNLKIYSVGFYHKWCDKNINASPLEMFAWFKNAELVITDTFHGSVLSIVTNAPLIVKLKENTNKLFWLLKEYSLENRIINSFAEIEILEKQKIDFKQVNDIVRMKRENSLQYLESALNG